MIVYLWLALGGALGTISRFALANWFTKYYPEFPMGTLVINITGSFLIGFFQSLTGPEGRWMVSPTFRIFFMTGICGGYTTFSSFSLQTLELARSGRGLYAGANVVASVVLCLIAVWLGYSLALLLKPAKGH